VSRLRLLVLGDGEHELGAKSSRGLDLTPGRLPALPCLMHRLLGEPRGTTYQPRSFHDVPPVHERGHKYARKVKRAILQAKRDGFDGLVVVIDRDRNRSSATVEPMREGRDALAEGGLPPCAVGVAVETFDAWMIVDAKAIKAAGGDATQSHPNPESLAGKAKGNHPKDVADAIFGTQGGTGLGPKYAIVAENVDLDLLSRTCPEGFAPFAEEVRQRIGHTVAGS
jgi:hypothetical protein